MTPTEAEVRALVRQALTRLQDAAPAPSPTAAADPARRRRRLIDAADIAELPRGGSLDLPLGAIVTPLAQDAARERNIRLTPTRLPSLAQPTGPSQKAIAIAADHGGFALKEQLKPYLTELGYEAVDVGTHSADAVDYPDIAYAAANLVAQKRCTAAIIIDGAGIGSCMAANKVPGIRASLCYDVSTAANAREHNHANVLTLGAGLIGPGLAKQIVKTWLETPWGGTRHARRVAKIMDIEKRFLKK